MLLLCGNADSTFRWEQRRKTGIILLRIQNEKETETGGFGMRKNNYIFCNCCGKKIRQENKVPMEDILYVKKSWGYFSKKDGSVHEFDLCEACYDHLVKQFVLPVKISRQKELL
jgi:hypothetical protein